MLEQQRISRRTAVRTAGTALVAGTAAATGTRAWTVKAGSAAGSLVGTWLVTVQRAGATPNGVLVTVLPDGSFLRTGTTHPVEGPGHGVWLQVDERVYDVTYLTLRFNEDGMFIGHRKAWLRITLDPSGEGFDGSVRNVAIDAGGVEATPTTAEIRGVRMMAEAFA